MYAFANKYNIDYNNCGKIIVATNEKQIEDLEKLKVNGLNNNVKKIKLLDKKDIKKREPCIRCKAGLFVPSTGIIDSHGFMKKLEYLTRSKNNIVYNTEASNISYDGHEYNIELKNFNYYIKSKLIINSTGLWSDAVSKMVGINNYKIHMCKGEYYKTSMYRNKINSLIYPLPNSVSLGTHVVLQLDGSIAFGPNAYYVDKIDYDFDNENKTDFVNNIKKFLEIPANSITKDYSGIRPKIQGPGELPKDFIIVNESKKGYNNFINLIGIDSPGLTSSLAIAEYVHSIINF